MYGLPRYGCAMIGIKTALLMYSETKWFCNRKTSDFERTPLSLETERFLIINGIFPPETSPEIRLLGIFKLKMKTDAK